MPRLTRAHPVASAAVERGVVADAAGQLDRDVQPADHLGEQRRGCRRGRTRRRGRRGGSTRRRRAARSARPRAGRRRTVSVPAAPWTSRTAAPSATSTAGSRTRLIDLLRSKVSMTSAGAAIDQRPAAATDHRAERAGRRGSSDSQSTISSGGSRDRPPLRGLRRKPGAVLPEPRPRAPAAASAARGRARSRRPRLAAGRRSRARLAPARRPAARALRASGDRCGCCSLAVTAWPASSRSSAAPASPDFSGWNWVALTGPCSTAATNGSPCSAVRHQARRTCRCAA